MEEQGSQFQSLVGAVLYLPSALEEAAEGEFTLSPCDAK